MAPRFLHIGYVFNPLSHARQLEVDGVISLLGDDWIRYALSSYMIWTDKTADEVFRHLKPHIKVGEQVFIVAVDMNDRSGWLLPVIWRWLDSKPREQSQSFAAMLQALQPPQSNR